MAALDCAAEREAELDALPLPLAAALAEATAVLAPDAEGSAEAVLTALAVGRPERDTVLVREVLAEPAEDTEGKLL